MVEWLKLSINGLQAKDIERTTRGRRKDDNDIMKAKVELIDGGLV
jgi:hypothetical protein